MDGLDSVLDESQVIEEQEVAEHDEPESVGVVDMGEEEAAPPAAEPQPEEDARQKGIQAALLAERRKRQEIEAKLQELQTKQPAADKPQGPPALDQFATYDEYIAAVSRYNARQEYESMRQQETARQQQEAQLREQMEFQRAIDARVAAGQAKYADFDAVVNTGLAPFLSQQLAHSIAESNAGHDVAYYLGKNPAEAARIADLPERQQIREIARLESRLEYEAKQPQKPTIPQTLTTARDTRGRFQAPAQDGPTPLDAVLR